MEVVAEEVAEDEGALAVADDVGTRMEVAEEEGGSDERRRSSGEGCGGQRGRRWRTTTE